MEQLNLAQLLLRRASDCRHLACGVPEEYSAGLDRDADNFIRMAAAFGDSWAEGEVAWWDEVRADHAAGIQMSLMALMVA